MLLSENPFYKSSRLTPRRLGFLHFPLSAFHTLYLVSFHVFFITSVPTSLCISLSLFSCCFHTKKDKLLCPIICLYQLVSFFLLLSHKKKTSNYTTKGYIKSQAYTQLTYNQTLLPHQLVSFFLLFSHKKRQAIVSNHLSIPACLFFLAAFTQKKTSNYTTKGYIKSQAYTQLTYNQTLLPHQLVSFFLLLSHKKKTSYHIPRNKEKKRKGKARQDNSDLRE